MIKVKALVTGGAGFIGSNLVEKLINNPLISKIVILDLLNYAGNLSNLKNLNKNKIKLVIGDVANGQLIANIIQEVDIVFHLAAETHVTRSIYDNYQFFHTDVIGTQSVANAVLKESSRRSSPIPLIHISTSEVYGTAVYEKMNEDHPLNPCSPYAAAKAGADRLVYSYAKTYDLNAIIIRPFNQYGPKQHPEKAIPRFITNAINNEPLPVHGQGNASRDWTHVYDTAEFLASLISKDLSNYSGEVFNIGNDSHVSILEIANMVSQNFKSASIKMIDERPGQVIRHTCDSSKARTILGWNPQRDLMNSLNSVTDWYKDNESVWEPLLLAKDVNIEITPGNYIQH